MKLSGADLARLQAAICGAYSASELTQFVRFKLDFHYDHEIAPQNFGGEVFDLLEHLERHGQLPQFLLGVREDRPKRLDLVPLFEELEAKLRADLPASQPGANHNGSPQPRNLPYGSIKSHFKGRERFLNDLHEKLRQPSTHAVAVVATQAIYGLGGIGKTRTAVEYAWRYGQEYTALLFATADSPENFNRNLAALCGPLILDLPEKEAREQEVQRKAVIKWLRDHSGWLLIVDNVDSEDAAKEVERRLVDLSGGHVLITSRLSDWPAEIESLELDVLDLDSAADLLLVKTNGKRRTTPTDPEDARRLADDLGRLALALDQAGAFIRKHGGTFADYRQRWAGQEEKVLTWYDERQMKYPKSVAVTWETTEELLSDEARALLRILCWLAPEPIPLTMLEKLENKEGQSVIDVESALAELRSYSLLKRDDGKGTVTVHRLVQEITRFRIPTEERKGHLERGLQMVNNFAVGDPWDVRTWAGVYTPGRSHLATVAGHGDANGILWPTSRLLVHFSLYLFEKSEFAEAEPLMRRALAIVMARYGKNHPDVATALNNLASLLQATNRFAEAEPLMRRALAIDEANYGTDHSDVARDLNNLALLLQATNRFAEAEPLMRRALAIDEANHGTDHPNVARDLNTLAELFKATNRLAEAELLMRRALAIDEANYGNDHPTVAAHINNLASLLHDTDRLAEAEPLMRRALRIDEARYGKDHSSVARDLNNLASLLRATNRLTEAELLMRQALTISEASCGEDHPSVATRLNNLAQLLLDNGHMAESERLMRRALEIDEASYGPEHPTIARDLGNLAQLLVNTNRPAEAEPLMQRVLRILFRFQLLTGYPHRRWDAALANYLFLLHALDHDQIEIKARISELTEEVRRQCDQVNAAELASSLKPAQFTPTKSQETAEG